MGTEIRLHDQLSGKDYSFSPARDIAYFWPQLIELAYEGLQESNWEPWLGDYLRANGVTEKDVLEALVAYSKFCMLSVKPEITDPEDALTEAGFFKTPKAAQLVVVAKFGQLATGAFWAGIRSSSRENQLPASIEALQKAAKTLEKSLVERWSDASIND